MPAAAIAIVGGGMSGLAAAYAHAPWRPVRAARIGHALGGVVKTERVDGFIIDAGPDAR